MLRLSIEQKSIDLVSVGCTHRPDKPYRIREHIRRHTQEKTIACPTCGSLFSCGVKFIEHCQLSADGKVHGERIDEEIFSLIQRLVSEQFQCDKCAQLFQSKSLLLKHLNKHGKEKPGAKQ